MAKEAINLPKEIVLGIWNGGAFKREPKTFDNDIREYYIAKDITTLQDPNDEESGITKTVLKLDHKESITEKIESQMDDTKLETIINKYNITGDVSLFNRSVPLDPKLSGVMGTIPLDPNEANDMIIKKRDEFKDATGLEKLTVAELMNLIKNNENAKQVTKESKKTETVDKKEEIKTTDKEPVKETKTEVTNNGNN